jgi:hypothetical protein
MTLIGSARDEIHLVGGIFQVQCCILEIRVVMCAVQLWHLSDGSAKLKKKKTKLHGLSPRANYTNRATAACLRSDCQLLRIRGCHVVSVTDPSGRILGFLDRSPYFSIK